MRHLSLHTRLERLESAVFRRNNLRMFRMKDGQTITLSQTEFYQAWDDFLHNDKSYLARVIEECAPNEVQQRWIALALAVKHPVTT
jgi:hypothetical protein